MINIFLMILIPLFSFNESLARKVCEPPLIKSDKEIERALNICDPGDKLLVRFDLKVRSENLIIKLCDLKHTIITKEDIGIIHKRKSGLLLICIYEPN